MRRTQAACGVVSEDDLRDPALHVRVRMRCNQLSAMDRVKKEIERGRGKLRRSSYRLLKELAERGRWAKVGERAFGCPSLWRR